MSPGVIVYRCRQCGLRYSHLHTSDVLASLALPVVGIDLDPQLNRSGQSPLLREIHTCDDTHIGVADLIGADIDKEAP